MGPRATYKVRSKVGEASLNWFTAPHARADRDHRSRRARSVLAPMRSRRTHALESRYERPTQLGRLRIDRAEANVVIRADGTTNIEEVLASFSTPPGRRPHDRSRRGHRARRRHDRSASTKCRPSSWQVVKLGGVVIVPRPRRPAAPSICKGRSPSPTGLDRLRPHGLSRRRGRRLAVCSARRRGDRISALPLGIGRRAHSPPHCRASTSPASPPASCNLVSIGRPRSRRWLDGRPQFPSARRSADRSYGRRTAHGSRRSAAEESLVRSPSANRSTRSRL